MKKFIKTFIVIVVLGIFMILLDFTNLKSPSDILNWVIVKLNLLTILVIFIAVKTKAL